MKTQEKIALTRIIVDLIKADNIIEVSEMAYLKKMKEKYDITQDDLISAQKVDFELAVNRLKNLSKKELDVFLDDMNQLALSYGNGSPEGTFIIMSLRFCLMPQYNYYCELITTNVTNITIDKNNIVYTETIYDKEINEQIDKTLRYIKDDFSIVGLNFVYIPEVCRDFKNMDEQYLKYIINFLAPSINKDNQEQIFNTLRNITTKEFCDDFLIKKMKLSMYDSDPSLLFQVCNSNDKVVYMHLTLNENILNDLQMLVDNFKSLTKINNSIILNQKENRERFLYYGFHKALFDLLAFPDKKIESRILIDLFNRKVFFMDLGENLDLSLKQVALYILIIQQSLCIKPHELLIKSPSEKRKDCIRKTFDNIYGMMGNTRNTEYTIGINPALSKIRKAINDLKNLDNVDAYLPERIDGTVRVKIKPEKVFVKKEDGRVLNIIDDVDWVNCKFS